MTRFKYDAMFQLGFLLFCLILVCEGQFYGKSVPCPVSYIDPDGDCVTGIAGKDYPLYFAIPKTTFRCSDHQINVVGYFADPEAHCQAFHVCLKNGIQESFLCPNGTLFNQQFLVCDWWFHVTCSDAQKFYPINEYLQPPIRYRDGPVHPNVVPMSQNNLLTSTSKSSTTSLSHDLLPVEGNSNFTNNTEDASNFQSDDSDVFPRTKLLNVSDDPDWAKMGFQDMRNKFVSSLDKSNPPIGLPRHL